MSRHSSSTMSGLSNKPFPTIASAISSTLSLLEYDSEALFRNEIDVQRRLLAEIRLLEDEAMAPYRIDAAAVAGFYSPMSPLAAQRVYESIGPSVQRLICSLGKLIGSGNELFQFYYRCNGIFSSFVHGAVRTLITKTHNRNSKAFNDSVELLLELVHLEPPGKLAKSAAEYYEEYLNGLLFELKDYLKERFDLKDALKVEDFQDDEEPLPDPSRPRDDQLTLFQIMKLNKLASKKAFSVDYMHKVFKLVYYCFSCVAYDKCKEFLRIAIEILIVYASADRTFSLEIIDVFIERNKNTIVSYEDSYRITLNRAPFSIIARYLYKCYFNYDGEDDFPFDSCELVTPHSLFEHRVKCLSMVQKYVLELGQNICSLNRIGGQSFARILHNYEKKLFNLVASIAEAQVAALRVTATSEDDAPARLLVECLKAVRPYANYHFEFFVERQHALFELLIEAVRLVSGRRGSGFSQTSSEVYKHFIAVLKSKALRTNVFVMHHWPRLKQFWAEDLAAAEPNENGSVLLIECLCKSSYARENLAALTELAGLFKPSVERNMADETTTNATLDAVHALVELYGQCQRAKSDVPVSQEQLGELRGHLIAILEVVQRTLARLKASDYFRASLSFYSRVFTSVRSEYTPFLEDDRVWMPHVELLLDKIELCVEAYYAKSEFALEAFLGDKFLDVYGLISGLNFYASRELLARHKSALTTFMRLLGFEENYQEELLRTYKDIFENL